MSHYYFYCIDEDFGPFFLKFCSFFPYNAKLCFNGHEYLKRQLEQRRIAYHALENGILSSVDPSNCNSCVVGYRRERSTPCSANGCDDSPIPSPPKTVRPNTVINSPFSNSKFPHSGSGSAVSGRIYFEEVIRENLDIGRPKQVQLIFDRCVSQGHARPISYTSHHRWSRPLVTHRLQRNAHQAVSQGRSGLTYGNHHQQHLRLLCRQEPAQLARASTHRL